MSQPNELTDLLLSIARAGAMSASTAAALDDLRPQHISQEFRLAVQEAADAEESGFDCDDCGSPLPRDYDRSACPECIAEDDKSESAYERDTYVNPQTGAVEYL